MSVDGVGRVFVKLIELKDEICEMRVSGYPRLARKSKMMMRNKESSKSAHFINVYAVDDTRGSLGDSWPLYVIGNSGLGFFLAHGPTDVLKLSPQQCKHSVRAHGGPLVSSIWSRISEAETVDCGRGASPRCPLYSPCQVMRPILACSHLLSLLYLWPWSVGVPFPCSWQNQIYGGKGRFCIIRNQLFWAYRRQLSTNFLHGVSSSRTAADALSLGRRRYRGYD